MGQEFARITTPLGEVILRAYEDRDVEAEIAYYHDSPRKDLEYAGLNPAAFPDREEMTNRWRKAFQKAAEKGALPTKIVAELNGKAIGAVYLDRSWPGETQLHFLIFEKQYRHQGLGGPIFANAVRQFSKLYKIDKFVIAPRSTNKPMNKLMKNFGFRRIGTGRMRKGGWMLAFNMSRYEVLIEDIEAYLDKKKNPVKKIPPQP